MTHPDTSETIREQISRAIADQLLRATDIDWASVGQLANPTVHIEATFRNGPQGPTHNEDARGLRFSHVVDLTGVATPQSGTPCEEPETLDSKENGTDESITETSPGTIRPVPVERVNPTSPETSASSPPGVEDNESHDSALFEHLNNSRKAISGLRPSRDTVTQVVEDNTQRQMQVTEASFPKRRKVEQVGYALKPSTLDKLVIGIWEQLHGGITIDAQDLLGRLTPKSLLQGSETIEGRVIPSEALDPSQAGNHRFSRNNVFCRQVTQTSRAFRSIEVIVQARWVEHFDQYVQALKTGNPALSETKHRKAALAEACEDFGWTEKELRNKMAVWRGYKEIKDAGGWGSLVFAGMGIYRFCKYRIGFDRNSMQRLRSVRPALEVAADTMHPTWRQLLAIVGEPTERLYDGHPHDWVISPDGSAPLPLRNTYLRWDPYFSFRHLDESVVDEKEWGCDDPRWAPPSATPGTMSPVSNGLNTMQGLVSLDYAEQNAVLCESCGKEQSDDAKVNACFCFPTLFGCAKAYPSPVQVFRTPNGRNNGLLALCAFERGTSVGEFIGVITRGLQDVDVMESSTLGPAAEATKYQICQSRQGNFTRFVNHSCNANAQYQRFTWLGTQRIVLVSKGIEAGTEITVDYSDKYWRGLDKGCLCGERSCRYRRG